MQIYTVFAYDKVREVTQKVDFGNSPPDPEDDDVDDEDDDDDEQANNQNSGFYDVFGDIKKKLSAEKLPFSEFPIKDDEKDDGLRRVRMFLDGFKKFKSEQIEKKYKGKEYEEYPRKHRFVSGMSLYSLDRW